ncbi:MAG TPA: aldose 1-epimerase [Chloroflexota bacterium]|nr:aldose 1-epimerase [Chloroflexota bacterium]
MPDLISLRAGDSEATVVPSVGANCSSFRVGGRDLLEAPPSLEALAARPTGYGCPILFPFPGQLEPGPRRLLGRDVLITANAPSGRHGHGFASARPWRVVERGADWCACQLEGGGGDEYPWRFRITARWRVSPGSLGLGLVVENVDHDEMPFGLGLHPYLPVAADALVDVPSAAEWPHEGGVPSGPPAAARGPWRWSDLGAGSSSLLTALPAGDVEARAGEVRLRWPGDRFGEVVLYRPPPERRSVCVEPWTSVSGAAARLEPGARGGLVRLAPHATWRAWMEIAPASS